MIPGAFEYHRAGSVEEAVALLGRFGEDGKVLAGGHSLIPMMKLRLAGPAHLIDINGVDALRHIREEGGDLLLGAAVTQAEILASALLAQKCPLIPEAAALVADPQVRNCGTIGGNVANGDPGNDMPAVMQALDAVFQLRGPNGAREVAARAYYEGTFVTARGDGEVLSQIRIPVPTAGHGYAYEKQKRKVGDYATAAAAVLLTLNGGRCESASVALTNVGNTPLYAEAAAKALVGTALDDTAIDEAVRLAEGITEPVSDGRGPAEFRTKVAGVMLRRAIARAKDRAHGA